jgi:hypothetical protein
MTTFVILVKTVLMSGQDPIVPDDDGVIWVKTVLMSGQDHLFADRDVRHPGE